MNIPLKSLNITCKQEQFFGASTQVGNRSLQCASIQEGKYMCEKCNKCFVQGWRLKRHMQLHTGHYKFYCDICKKGFSDSTHYNEHKRNHEGLKYHCDYCAKPFVTKRAYQYHLSVHTGKYRFTCNICGKGFNDKPDLDKHVKYHS